MTPTHIQALVKPISLLQILDSLLSVTCLRFFVQCTSFCSMHRSNRWQRKRKKVLRIHNVLVFIPYRVGILCNIIVVLSLCLRHEDKTIVIELAFMQPECLVSLKLGCFSWLNIQGLLKEKQPPQENEITCVCVVCLIWSCWSTMATTFEERCWPVEVSYLSLPLGAILRAYGW